MGGSPAFRCCVSREAEPAPQGIHNAGAMSMKKLVLETTAPFQGLPELVAYDEGLFEKEGLQIQWADREKGVEKKTDTSITSQKGQDPFSRGGGVLEPACAAPHTA